ncbi:MAG: Rieske 2Fe-2S domain-containing protein [Myxococcales bacterium]|nr:Rieske 2Fe-2S domain-containing protein [Myxococcales bacterium]
MTERLRRLGPFHVGPIHIGRRLPNRPLWSTEPDWVQASEPRIARMLDRALARPSGGWLVVDQTRAIGDVPRKYVIDGQELVAWRSHGRPVVAPASCPHMGADLSTGCVRAGRLVCPWHGLSLGPDRHGRWAPLRTYDDGVLVWVRGESADAAELTDAPLVPARPGRFLDATIRMEAACDPADIVANRLDPWHGAHYHPHSFASLDVLEVTDDIITLRVAYRVAGPVEMLVDASFHSPEPNTIVMTIIAGDGVGSVVETHATPIGKGRTAVIESTLATSDRPGFGWALRAAKWLRPAVESRARRLWVEDIAYAERRYLLREGQEFLRPSASFPKTLRVLSR